MKAGPNLEPAALAVAGSLPRPLVGTPAADRERKRADNVEQPAILFDRTLAGRGIARSETGSQPSLAIRMGRFLQFVLIFCGAGAII